MDLRPADLADPRVVRLIDYHQRAMLAASPPGSSFALDLSGLVDPAVVVIAAWDGEHLAGIAAVKRLGHDHAELKSMRTHPAYLRRGTASALLEHVISIARQQGVTRLSLETGRGPEFDAALALYRRRGFFNGEAFADYANTEFNQCLHLDL